MTFAEICRNISFVVLWQTTTPLISQVPIERMHLEGKTNAMLTLYEDKEAIGSLA